jgi:hypothetical protein
MELIKDFSIHNPFVKKNISKTYSALLDEMDNLELIKSKCDYDKEFPKLVTTTTRVKIIRDLILLFKCFKTEDLDKISQDEKEKMLEVLKICRKRIRLHLFQLKILNPYEVPSNITYFNMIIKIALTLLLKK